MNPAISFWRLAWKEYRTQKNLWLSVLILAMAVQWIVAMVAAINQYGPVPGPNYLVMGFVAVAVYMLGCGATLFALEHESGTYDFQRLLPVSAKHVLGAKLGVGIVSGFGLFAALIFLEHAFFVGWETVLGWQDWLAGVVNILEVFFWAILFSLLLRHPLRAAVCGIVAMTVSVCVLLPTNSPTLTNDMLLYHRSSLSIRFCIIGVLAVLDAWLAWRWFYGGIKFPKWSRWPSDVSDYVLMPTQPMPSYFAERSIGFRRLAGISLRQGRWLIFLVCALFLWTFSAAFTGTTWDGRSQMCVSVVVLSALIFGSCTFTFDQWSDQYRFYAEHGVSPRWLWLSRHLVWFLPLAIQLVFMLWLTAVKSVRPYDSLGYALIAVITYSLSQCAAMFIRSTLVAMVVSTFIAFIGAFWTATMANLGIPLWWSAAPIPVIAMFTTWWLSKDWIEERKGRAFWKKFALAVGLPAIAILTACMGYRAYEIPLVDPGFNVSEYSRPLTSEERQTLELYEQADKAMTEGAARLFSRKQDPNVTQEQHNQRWLEAARPALSYLVQAHHRAPVPLTLAKSVQPVSGHIPDFLGEYNPVAFLLLVRLEAESLTSQNKLSEAWQHYEIAFELLNRFRARAADAPLHFAAAEEKAILHSISKWAAHPEQSTDRIKVAISGLERIASQESDQTRLAKIHYILWTKFLSGEPISPVALGGMPPEGAASVRTLTRWMPWEKERTLRMLNIVSNAYIPHSSPQTPPVQTEHWLRTTIGPVGHIPVALRFDREIETWRRATQVLIALADWQRVHGSLPDRLDQLVGPYFVLFPIDPATSGPFEYFPKGAPVDIQPVAASPQFGTGNIPKGTPILWSPGQSNVILQQNADGTYRAALHMQEFSLEDGLQQGLTFRIPIISKTAKAD